ncbi:beta/alpha barrel domain-containing protein [Desulfosporosinus shakirovi]|uniref:hypothetical protein n=1 Tax=Desulfosporosinus shakirovi TaxID=2885154 RepID=UPI001E3C6C2D|nr:hypothetical protein [Desulfosporosinus sp. SRJS8]MCB8818826.1 hypothetical protein [Desulfosporosinus sp. SRJS8]
MIKLRDDMIKKYGYSNKIRVGAAGGIGTPEVAAAAFILGADYILTGSINQCTVESRTSKAVKELLQQINIQDTEYAPAGDMPCGPALGAFNQWVKGSDLQNGQNRYTDKIAKKIMTETSELLNTRYSSLI